MENEEVLKYPQEPWHTKRKARANVEEHQSSHDVEELKQYGRRREL